MVSFLLILINAYGIRHYIGTPELNPNPTQNISIGLFNVLTSNDNYQQLIKQIENEHPKVVILQEIDEKWIDNTTELKTNYPYILQHPREDNFGIAIYSKIPFKSSEIEYWTEAEVPVIHAALINDIEIYGIHTLPPVNENYFKIRNKMLKQINEISDKKVIICGDLNTTVYSPSYKKFVGAANLQDAQIAAKNVSGTWNTRHFPLFRIPLEHILYSEHFSFKNFYIGKNFGSDHLPIFATIEW